MRVWNWFGWYGDNARDGRMFLAAISFKPAEASAFTIDFVANTVLGAVIASADELFAVCSGISIQADALSLKNKFVFKIKQLDFLPINGAQAPLPEQFLPLHLSLVSQFLPV